MSFSIGFEERDEKEERERERRAKGTGCCRKSKEWERRKKVLTKVLTKKRLFNKYHRVSRRERERQNSLCELSYRDYISWPSLSLPLTNVTIWAFTVEKYNWIGAERRTRGTLPPSLSLSTMSPHSFFDVRGLSRLAFLFPSPLQMIVFETVEERERPLQLNPDSGRGNFVFFLLFQFRK